MRTACLEPAPHRTAGQPHARPARPTSPDVRALLAAQVLEKLGRKQITSYTQEGALEQLWYVDMAYLALISAANWAFPYILLPAALNPMQLMLPPNDVEIPMPADAAPSR